MELVTILLFESIDEKSGKYIDFYLPGYYMFSEENF